MTTVSVIIPTYNRADFIAAAITSVLDQKTTAALEVIVVDDGSTDNTAKVVERFGDRVIYRQIPNSGRPAVPRNVGLQIATGQLVAFQDSDDLWAPGKLARQLAAFDQAEVLLSYGNATIMTADGKITDKLVVNPEDCKSGNVFSYLVNGNFISTLTVMARRSSLLEAGGFNESPALRGVEDYELWLRMAALGQIKFVDHTLAYYRQHGGNISDVPSRVVHKRLLAVYKSVLRSDLTPAQRRLVLQKISRQFTAQLPITTGQIPALLLKIQAKFYWLKAGHAK